MTNRSRSRKKKQYYQKALNRIRTSTTSNAGPAKKRSASQKKRRFGRSLLRVRRILSFLVFPFQQKYRVATIAALISICFIGIFLYLIQSKPIEVRAELTELGDINFTYSGKQNSGISPLCGCYDEKPRDVWRGITFPARYIDIHREGTSPFTGYMITAAVPDNVNWMPSIFRLQGTIFTLAIPKDERFDPRLLLSSQLHANYHVIHSKTYAAAPYFLLISGQRLRIALLGSTPLASWIPTDNSHISLKYRTDGMHLSAKDIAIIEETYVNTESNIAKREWLDGVPLGDFLGSDVVFWSEDQSAVMIAASDVFEFDRAPAENERIVHAVVAQPPFSARLAADPLEAEGVTGFVKGMKEVALLPEEKKRGFAYERSMVLGQLDDGKITLTVNDPEDQAKDFDEVYSRMKENSTVWGRITVEGVLDNGEEFLDSKEMIFRYPPIPPNKGFNVFGPISSLEFSKAVGALAIGSRNIDIKVPSLLNLKDIQSIDVDKGSFTVPIQLNTAEQKAAIHLKATSETFLNYEPLNRRSDQYGVTYLSIRSLSLLISLLSLLVSIRSLTKKQASSRKT